MKHIIICLGILLSFSSCEKEELEPTCTAIELNMTDTITMYFERQESNGTFRSHGWSQDNYPFYLDTFMATTPPPFTMDGWLSWSFDSANSNPDYYIFSSGQYLINPSTWDDDFYYITIPIQDIVTNGDTIVIL